MTTTTTAHPGGEPRYPYIDVIEKNHGQQFFPQVRADDDHPQEDLVMEMQWKDKDTFVGNICPQIGLIYFEKATVHCSGHSMQIGTHLNGGWLNCLKN